MVLINDFVNLFLCINMFINAEKIYSRICVNFILEHGNPNPLAVVFDDIIKLLM